MVFACNCRLYLLQGGAIPDCKLVLNWVCYVMLRNLWLSLECGILVLASLEWDNLLKLIIQIVFQSFTWNLVEHLLTFFKKFFKANVEVVSVCLMRLYLLGSTLVPLNNLAWLWANIYHNKRLTKLSCCFYRICMQCGLLKAY